MREKLDLWTLEELQSRTRWPIRYCRSIVAMLEPARARTWETGKQYHVHEMMAAALEIERNKRVSFDSSDAKQRAEMARAEKLEIENAVRRGQLVSLVDQVSTDSKVASMLARKLEAIPGRIKRRYPDMPGKYLAALADGLSVARNEHVEEFEDWVRTDAEDSADAEASA